MQAGWDRSNDGCGGLIPRPLDVRPRSEMGKTRDDAREARPRNAELVGAPRPALPARGEVCTRPPRRASPTEMNETGPRSKFSEIGHTSADRFVGDLVDPGEVVSAAAALTVSTGEVLDVGGSAVVDLGNAHPSMTVHAADARSGAACGQ